VIPALADVLEGWTFVARRQGLAGEVHAGAVAAALDHARVLTRNEAEEPAALFYAFACRPRAFLGGWRLMPGLIAINQAHALGYRLHAAPGELDPLRHHIATPSARPPFDEVRDWFAARLMLIHGSDEPSRT
jgi:hypothetical protein